MKSLKGKKLLILGGASLHKKLVETAHEMGVTTIVTDNIVNAPAKLISDYSYDVNVTNIDELEKICYKEKVDGIVSGYLDFCQRYYEELCRRVHLPCYGTYEQFQILTNKDLFKKKCLECGVDIIPSYEEEMFLNEQTNIQYPIYVKPSYSRGSRGQYICHNYQEAVEAINKAKEISEDNHAIIERYMQGDIIQVSYIIVNRKAYLLRTADQYNGKLKDGMDHICIAASSPSIYTDFYLKKVHPKVLKLIEKLEIINAPFFMQGFIDGDKVRFFDPGLRFPGTEYARLLKMATGIDTPKALVEFALTGEMSSILKQINPQSVYLNGKTIMNLFPVLRPGKISKITSEKKILAINGIKYITFRRSIGDVMHFTGDVNQRIAEVNILCNSKKEMQKAIEDFESQFKVLDEDNHNMVFANFEISDWKVN